MGRKHSVGCFLRRLRPPERKLVEVTRSTEALLVEIQIRKNCQKLVYFLAIQTIVGLKTGYRLISIASSILLIDLDETVYAVLNYTIFFSFKSIVYLNAGFNVSPCLSFFNVLFLLFKKNSRLSYIVYCNGLIFFWIFPVDFSSYLTNFQIINPIVG